ncbi:disintegrin and metalloproteinase domain-containing protein 21-like [Candoia aspera]|uniref:disintegrin and metalloproteinase domain-containing protein 21-like n=1 Tax=Candoia aspera TaxID=51853 RepID=UPI002FD8580C
MASGRDLGHWFFFLLVTCIVLVVFTLSTVHCSSLPPLAYTSYEVIIPRRLAAQMGETTKDEISYIIKAAGRDYIIRLKPKKNFLAKNLPIFTYNSKGECVESHPYIAVECYHQGYVEGIVDSLAVLRTCFGLSGFLKIGARTYGIEPLQNSSAFRHLLYLSEESEPTFSSHRMGVGRTNHQAEKLVTRQIRTTYNNLKDQDFPKYIELYIVVDKNLFAQEANNVSSVETIVLDVVNIVDATFSSLNTHVVLVGLEIWTEKNLITISADIRQVLRNFNKWRIVNKRSTYDTAFLFLRQSFSKISGTSYKSAICRPALSAGLQVYLKNEVIRFVMGFSHELGNHIGMEPDGSNCFCSKSVFCIMRGHYATVNLFSNCSILNLKRLYARGLLGCLLNVPRIRSNLDYCGNGVLNAGEQCDCGGKGRCEDDSCCTPKCVLKEKATCAVGECCQSCQYLPKGTICRDKASDCDLPEYCDGRSARCPKDLYAQDGTPCDEHSYCYRKRCWDHNFLCKRIFSREAVAAPETCYALNALGNKYGNCGTDSTGKRFLKCQPKDSMCGRVQCTDVGPASVLKLEVHRHDVQKTPCWSIAASGNIHHEDIGAVPNGIMCAPRKICINHSCVPITALNLSCNSRSMCQNKGVCNNLHKCHCNDGWAPPDCKKWGAGGSIDGGFPEISNSTKLVKRILVTVIPFSFVAVAAAIEIIPKVGEFLASVTRWWR